MGTQLCEFMYLLLFCLHIIFSLNCGALGRISEPLAKAEQLPTIWDLA